jgi:iron complex transport system substrate-binding protein
MPTLPRARRLRLPLFLVLVLGLLAAACGDDDDAAGSATTTSPPAAESAYPVTIEHKFGETVVPAAPARVVSLGYTEQDSIVLFGIQPVAVRYAFGPEDDLFFPWADEAAGDAQPEVLPRADLNFEQIAALDPDLIMAVTAGLTQEQYDTLSAIAPVVVQPKEYVDFGTPWDVQTLVAGKAFGQEARAQEIVDEVSAIIDAAREEHPEFAGLTLALSGPTYDGEYPFHASDDTRTRFFVDLGFVVPDELDAIAGDLFYGYLSKERADLLDTDVLVFQSGAPEERAGIEGDAILSALPVVAEGRSLFIEGSDYDAIQFASALSLPYLVESFAPKLAEAAS